MSLQGSKPLGNEKNGFLLKDTCKFDTIQGRGEAWCETPQSFLSEYGEDDSYYGRTEKSNLERS